MKLKQLHELRSVYIETELERRQTNKIHVAIPR